MSTHWSNYESDVINNELFVGLQSCECMRLKRSLMAAIIASDELNRAVDSNQMTFSFVLNLLPKILMRNANENCIIACIQSFLWFSRISLISYSVWIQNQSFIRMHSQLIRWVWSRQAFGRFCPIEMCQNTGCDR